MAGCCLEMAKRRSPPPCSPFSHRPCTWISLALTFERSKGVGSRTLAEAATGHCLLSGQSQWLSNIKGYAILTSDKYGSMFQKAQEGTFGMGRKGQLGV